MNDQQAEKIIQLQQQQLDMLKKLTLAVEELNKQQSSQLAQIQLGFGEIPASPYPEYIYANRHRDQLWYFLSAEDKRQIPIPHKALTAVILDLKISEVQRDGQQTLKAHLLVKADKPYIIETGHDTVFIRCIIASILEMSESQLKNSVTLVLDPGDSRPSILLCDLYDPIAQEYIRKPEWWRKENRDNINWQTLTEQAITKIRKVHGNKTEAKIEPSVTNKFSSSVESLDRPAMLERTNTYLEQLKWDAQQGRDYLEQRYGKRSRQLLTDEELLEFMYYLKSSIGP